MTTQEKAKAYEEALEKARKINSGEGVEAPPDWTICEVIFPQLKESEDERIRKWIFNCIDSLGYPADEDAEKELEEMQPLALAWLEKQKEPENVSASTMIPSCWEEEQKEQKPIIINQDEKEFLADEITAFLCNYDKEFDGEDPVPSEVAEHFYLLGKQAQEQPEVNLEKFIEKAQRVLYSSNPDDYIKLVKELAELGKKGGSK